MVYEERLVLEGGKALMLYLFLQLLGFPPQSSASHIKIGDKVRVKTSVTTPKYKWGSVTHRSVGVVKGNVCAKWVMGNKIGNHSNSLQCLRRELFRHALSCGLLLDDERIEYIWCQ